ncbi:MAG: response regulator [Anaerolineae bacterium]|jgi:pilus assembly protein CpaE|nr:response regulator [Anaerolineae bacterium]
MGSGSEKRVIKVLIVDDISDTRENLRKLLAFEADIQVVGDAGTGREAIQVAGEVQPDVVLMDINMPDMDGITATKAISTAVRTAAVVIMSVQSEPDYLRQAMLAGARDYLTKPISSEELYATIRRVYERNEPIRQQEAQMASMKTVRAEVGKPDYGVPGAGAGHVIVLYSPQGGVGTTTLATNLASALMRQDTRVLLIDCDLQFGDVDAFLNLQSQSSILDLIKAVNDLDMEIIDNVLVTHTSGLKVLVAPPHPELAYDIRADAVQQLVEALARSYDYVVIDTSTQYDDMTLKLFDVAERIVLVSNGTIPAIRNTRKMLDIFDHLKNPPNLSDKVFFVLNRIPTDRERSRGMVPVASIENHLKRKVDSIIPLEERTVLTSVNQGVPLVAKLKTRSPGREMAELAELIRQAVEAQERQIDATQLPDTRSKSGIRALFGGTG